MAILLNEPKDATIHILQGNNTVLVGPAGSQKSTLIRSLDAMFGDSLIKVSPTGLAALNINGTTVHRQFGLPFEPYTQYTELRKLAPNTTKLLKSDAIQGIVLDEISMLRSDALSCIDMRLREIRKQPNKPFGGLQMILLGDPGQLPPVVTGSDDVIIKRYYNSPWFFDCDSYVRGDFNVLKLEKTYRQTDPVYIKYLTDLRFGRNHKEVLEYFNSMCYRNIPSDNMLHLCATNVSVDQINRYFLEKIAGPAMVYRATITGEFKERPVPEQIHLKVGAKVIICVNDPKGEYVNGSTGSVLSMSKDGVLIELDANNKAVWINNDYEWKLHKYELDKTGRPRQKKTGGFKQLPVKLAWGLTVHKAQGATLNQGILDFGPNPLFSEGQLYTALSRFTSLDAVYTKRLLTTSDIKTSNKFLNWYHTV